MKLTDIRIGKRHRAHVGDVRSLAASIAQLGLLHPVVIDGDGRLVAGARTRPYCRPHSPRPASRASRS